MSATLRGWSCRVSAQREPDPFAQSLRIDGSPAWHFPYVLLLGRSKIRELAFKGDIPGVIKASW